LPRLSDPCLSLIWNLIHITHDFLTALPLSSLGVFVKISALDEILDVVVKCNAA
jgi:hypothetical protein